MRKKHFLLASLSILLAVVLFFGCSREKTEYESSELLTDEDEVIVLDIPEIEEEEPAATIHEELEVTGTSAGVRYILEFPQLTGSFTGPGVNLTELNPANYQVINQEAMISMGMSPWYTAYLAGVRYYEDRNFNRAIAELNQTISLNPDFTNAYVYRGNAHMRMGNLNGALNDYNRALSLDSSYAEVFNYRGYVHSQRGDFQLAIADFTQAIRFSSSYADAYFNRAYAHAKLGNWDLSIADYTQVIRLEPDNAIAYNQRGNAWFDRGDRVNAALDYEAADRLRPGQ